MFDLTTGAHHAQSSLWSASDPSWADRPSQKISISISFTMARLLRKGIAVFLPAMAFE
jgi:hypothetical protein